MDLFLINLLKKKICLDPNRESVVSQGFILPITKQLQNDTLAKLVIPVLYNICIDYGK